MKRKLLPVAAVLAATLIESKPRLAEEEIVDRDGNPLSSDAEAA